jgi:hypothetical protein
MNIQRHLITILATLVLSMVAASPLCTAAPALEDFKAKIDAVVGGLGPATNGIVEWAGADPLELRSDGDTMIAAVTGARLTFNADAAVHVILERIEVRYSPAQDGKNSADLAVLLPKQVKFAESDGTDTDLAIEGGQVNVAIDAKSGGIRATAGTIAGVRIVQPITGASLDFGPVSMTLKLVAETDGRWNAPTEFELRKVDFRFPQVPGSGGIDRIAPDQPRQRRDRRRRPHTKHQLQGTRGARARPAGFSPRRVGRPRSDLASGFAEDARGAPEVDIFRTRPTARGGRTGHPFLPG